MMGSGNYRIRDQIQLHGDEGERAKLRWSRKECQENAWANGDRCAFQADVPVAMHDILGLEPDADLSQHVPESRDSEGMYDLLPDDQAHFLKLQELARQLSTTHRPSR